MANLTNLIPQVFANASCNDIAAMLNRCGLFGTVGDSTVGPTTIGAGSD
jgi:hypothetical protein